MRVTCPMCQHTLFEISSDGEVVYKRGGYSFTATGQFLFKCKCGFVLRYNTAENQILGQRADVCETASKEAVS